MHFLYLQLSFESFLGSRTLIKFGLRWGNEGSTEHVVLRRQSFGLNCEGGALRKGIRDDNCRCLQYRPILQRLLWSNH